MNPSFELFKKEYDEALNVSRGLFLGVKTEGYNAGGVEIRDYWKYGGVRDIAYMCHAKAKRLISLSSLGKVVGDCDVADTCVDLINYAAFAYAEHKVRDHELKLTYKRQLIASLKGEPPAVAAAMERAETVKDLNAEGKHNPDAVHLQALAGRVRELEDRLSSL